MRFTAYLLCGNWHEAEDVMQSAFMKLYQAGPRLADRSGIEAYLRQVDVRTFLAERRRLRWRRFRTTRVRGCWASGRGRHGRSRLPASRVLRG
ncbi:sigma factor [Lentzea sp. BCCO 10_0856]|uniref:Sigma factor n=1 Tax=Lentzea miocenica TaxID=3095431 RepID=A0ABU4SZI8_9PSEU|nr:sigma factor [Lentzea sp. BCCO 10_0856]MDX8031303.1 sigma factor [Lentzea sp. BCCO 10_0856]